LERAGLKRDYIIYPAVILFFDLILMFSGNHLTQKFLRKIKSEDGKKELKTFRRRCYDKLCCKCKCKKNKVQPIDDKPEDSDHESEIEDDPNTEIKPTPLAPHKISPSGVVASGNNSMFVSIPNSNSNMPVLPVSKKEQ